MIHCGLSTRCIPWSACARLTLLSRFSHLVLSSPVNQACAAMCVQPSGVEGKAIQHIVLNYLPPPLSARSSSFIVCPPPRHGGGNVAGKQAGQAVEPSTRLIEAANARELANNR